jgi:hypothetical protein
LREVQNREAAANSIKISFIKLTQVHTYLLLLLEEASNDLEGYSIFPEKEKAKNKQRL